jgi:hypothetical protein
VAKRSKLNERYMARCRSGSGFVVGGHCYNWNGRGSE